MSVVRYQQQHEIMAEELEEVRRPSGVDVANRSSQEDGGDA